MKNTKSLKAVIGNELLEGRYNISEPERNVFFLLLSSIKRGEKLHPNRWYSADIDEYSRLSGLSRRSACEAVKLATDRLGNRTIILKEGKTKVYCKFISGIELNLENDTVRVTFHHSLLPYISELRNRFTSIDVAESFLLSNNYVNRLYILLSTHRWNKREKHLLYELEDLYNILDVPETYKVYKEFNRHILTRTKEELHRLKLCKITINTKRFGRKVVSIIFKVVWPEDEEEALLERYCKKLQKEFNLERVTWKALSLPEEHTQEYLCILEDRDF